MTPTFESVLRVQVHLLSLGNLLENVLYDDAVVYPHITSDTVINVIREGTKVAPTHLGVISIWKLL